MAQVGVMIEAQEGLTWPRWRRIVADAERLGFAALRTSDHCQSVMGVAGRDSLSTWPALALAAEWTHGIELGPMVSPLTFYVPAVLARMARAVDELSGGRLVLGLGTGWNEAEHEAFGIPFPSWRQRFDNLEAGIERIKQTLGEHRIPLLVGGRGRRRTLAIAAREASEWNTTFADPEEFQSASQALNERCRAVGREPSEIRRSLMRPYLVGRDREELRRRVSELGKAIPGLGSMDADEALEVIGQRFFVGTPDQVVEQMRPYVEAGVQLFMLQHFLLDEPEMMELLAAEVMPAL